MTKNSWKRQIRIRTRNSRNINKTLTEKVFYKKKELHSLVQWFIEICCPFFIFRCFMTCVSSFISSRFLGEFQLYGFEKPHLSFPFSLTWLSQSSSPFILVFVIDSSASHPSLLKKISADKHSKADESFECSIGYVSQKVQLFTLAFLEFEVSPPPSKPLSSFDLFLFLIFMRRIAHFPAVNLSPTIFFLLNFLHFSSFIFFSPSPYLRSSPDHKTQFIVFSEPFSKSFLFFGMIEYCSSH